MLRRFHRRRAMSAVLGRGGSCHRPVIRLGALQRFAFLALGFVSLGRLSVSGVDGVVAWQLLPDGACRTRASTARRTAWCRTTGILTAQ